MRTTIAVLITVYCWYVLPDNFDKETIATSGLFIVVQIQGDKIMNLLFVCSENRLRSPTGEAVFSQYEGINALGCGINSGAERQVSAELIDWADTIFVMEKLHQREVSKRFNDRLKDKKLICLDIPDIYARMDPLLVQLLTEKVSRHIELP